MDTPEPEEPDVTVIDFATDGHMLPAPEGVCGQCAVDHPPEIPHDPQSIFYQVWFLRQRGRYPTWADAMEHCTDETKAAWRAELAKRGVTETDLGE